MPVRRTVEPTYPSNSSRPADIYRALITLQEWVMSMSGLFNDYADTVQLDSSMRINKKDKIFWCTEEQFCAMSVVHMYDVLVSLQRIREAYDEARRCLAAEGGTSVTANSSLVGMHFDLLCHSVSLLAVATVESEAKEAVYHQQVLEILQSLREQQLDSQAATNKELREQRRMLEYVFRRK